MCGLLKREGLADVDLGFAFLTRYWSRGYAAEAAQAVLAYGRSSLNMRRIVAIVAADNRASIAVLEKVGLEFERRVRLSPDGPELELFGPALRERPA
jgi:RimJ/RimL family protein N-acetyltransferase